MKKLRVCFAEASSAFGGSNISTIDIIQHLEIVDKDLQLYYVAQCNTPSYKYADMHLSNDKLHHIGNNGIRGISDIIHLFGYMLRAWNFLKKNQIDIVHCTNETLLWWLLPCLFSDAEPVWNIRAELPKGLKHRIRRYSYLLFCQNIIGVSNAVLKSVFIENNKHKYNLVVIRNFVPNRLITQTSNQKHLPKRLDAECKIGFIGRLDDDVKNPERAIEIFLGTLKKANTFISLHFWGNVSDKKQKQLERIIPDSYRKHFHFHGQQEDIEIIYNDIDILLLTSRAEGSPRVIMESAMYNIPSVAHAIGGVPELISDSKTGFLFMHNEEAIAHLIQLINNLPLRRKMGQSAKTYYIENLNYNLIVKKYTTFYRHIKHPQP